MAGILDLLQQLEPYDPSKHRPADIGMGGMSTEVLATEYDSQGVPMNFPTLWFTKDGQPVPLPPNYALDLAIEYEKATGKQFPRFDSIDAGVNAASGRSNAGGAVKGLLAQ